MRRLPSNPVSEEYKHVQYRIQKSFQRRMVTLIVISYVCLFALLVNFFFGSSLWENFKYRLNGIDCEVVVPDFANGSTVIVECEGETAVIDSGEDGHDDELLSYIESRDIGKIDYLIVSELSDEYLNVLSEISDSSEIGKIILPLTDDEVMFSRFDDMLFSNGVTFLSAFEGMYLYFDDVNFIFCDPESVVIDIKFGNHSFLTFNDLDESEELAILDSRPDLNSDVLLSLNGDVPSGRFLETVTPDIIVLNNTGNSDVGLSSDGKFSENVYRTDSNGEIIIKSNEVDLKINCENQ